MRTIDIARLRSYNIDLLLQHDLTLTLFYLTKVEHLRKSEKIELLWELKNTLQEIPEAASTDDTSAVIFDFFTYCRKVPKKKLSWELMRICWSTQGPFSRIFQATPTELTLYFRYIWKWESSCVLCLLVYIYSLLVVAQPVKLAQRK